MVGIYAPRDWLDGFGFPAGARFRLANSAEGHEKLLAAIRVMPGAVKVGFEGSDRSPEARWSGFSIIAGWYDGIGPKFGYGIVALARVIGTVDGDTGYLLIGRNLAEQFGAHQGITRIAAGDFNRPNFQCFLVDPELDLAPDAAFCTAVLARSPGKRSPRTVF